MLIVDTHFEDNAINELEFIPLGGEPISRPAPQSLIALGDYNGSIPIAWKVPSGRTPPDITFIVVPPQATATKKLQIIYSTFITWII